MSILIQKSLDNCEHEDGGMVIILRNGLTITWLFAGNSNLQTINCSGLMLFFIHFSFYTHL